MEVVKVREREGGRKEGGGNSRCQNSRLVC